MQLYKVESLALFYSATPPADLRLKSFIAVYRLENKKTFRITVRENDDTNHLILKTIPTHVMMEPAIYDSLSMKESTSLLRNVDFCSVKITKLYKI